MVLKSSDVLELDMVQGLDGQIHEEALTPTSSLFTLRTMDKQRTTSTYSQEELLREDTGVRPR